MSGKENCAHCPVHNKVCMYKGGKGPAFCPTINQAEVLERALKEYDDPKIREFARMASLQEAECYANREQKPLILHPTKNRVEEVIEFAKKMKYHRLGVAFCSGFQYEANIFATILKNADFDVVSVNCKVGGVQKEQIGIKEEEKICIGHYETMCNPISQAEILNEAGTEFNIMMGLCVGHDSLFLKYVKAPTTVLTVKDRVLGHNPMAAIYLARIYYSRLLGLTFDDVIKKMAEK